MRINDLLNFCLSCSGSTKPRFFGCKSNQESDGSLNQTVSAFKAEKEINRLVVIKGIR